MKLGAIIKDYCRSHGVSQRQFALSCGLSSGYITMLVQDRNPSTDSSIKPKIETYDAIAKAMSISLDELFSMMDDAPIELPKRRKSDVEFLKPENLLQHKIPIIGSVAGGEPIYDEEVDLYISGPTKASCAVRLKGHSMEPTYQDGDIIYIREQPNVNDGQIAVVIMDDEASLKRVYHVKNGLQLLSENPKFAPIMATYDDYSNIRILGIPCGYTRMFDNSVKIPF